MEEIKIFKKKIIMRSLLFFATVFIISVVIRSKAICFGFAFGYLISVLNFQLLSLDISKIVLLNTKKYTSLLIIKFFLRYIVIALAMIIALKYELNIISFLAGFFLIQITILIDNYFKLRQVT